MSDKKLSLTQQVINQLRDSIKCGDVLPGDKLPTEKKLINQYSVSRTVIREAISGLKADGILTSRQGSGVFVLKKSRQIETLALLSESPQTISDVIESLELRAAVETGAAIMAAERCSPAQEADIYQCFRSFKKKVLAEENSEKEDFSFHVSIAKAANNDKFVDFLTLLGRNIIPRSQLRVEANLAQDMAVENRILLEHEAIMEAITSHDVDAARIAMHEHLTKGGKRYRDLARVVQSI